MNFTLAALLLLLAVIFASYGLGFLAFIIIIILVLLAITETGARARGGYSVDASGSAKPQMMKKTVTTSADGTKKTKITSQVSADEVNFPAPGQPADYGKTSYEQFGSGLGAVVWGTARLAYNGARWIFGGKKK
ncbi:hypothetical protein AUJ14_02520 [Candidatus Micrarchaeota archaeon CG1_02_55_22]|nr:MAG: hypothetical protein AUJ14_02520 [Candidatus Micrarchaeota archaeon CG1_02_55_22]